ncbi:ATP-binding protein [Desulfogranum mediterraneum]|uniref:ATP-binding protein n=1 Tax=Desulfogranum mediterraneum TaxID=160661 RepID=UPI0003FC3FF1|nr:ATP-binding protein [Desulfogranum mediterraneum]
MNLKRLTLRWKIFLVILVTNVAVIAGMLLFMLYSFTAGFSEYTGRLEQEQLQTLSSRLAALYQDQDSFTFLQRDQGIARYLEELLLEEMAAAMEDEAAAEEGQGQGELEELPVFFVLDPEKQPLFGGEEYPRDTTLLPILVSSRTVGWVGLHDPELFIEQQIFIDGQYRDLFGIAALVLFFSISASLLVAHHFEGRLRVIADATRALARGSYTSRIPVRSRDELGKLSRDFNSLAVTLDENERNRKKWVEDISHELKNPLTLISGELEAVRDGIRPLAPQTIDLLSTDIEHLKKLVNDLNELWQTEAGAMRFQPAELELEPLLRQVVEGFYQQFDDRQLTLEYRDWPSCPLRVLADEQRLRQLLTNLLQNGLCYTDPGGLTQVLLEQEAGEACMVIQDSAPGVPRAAYTQLFERLYRVEPSRNREFGGAGIGLAICKNITLAHGGSITAEPSPLGGLLVRIRLPLLP